MIIQTVSWDWCGGRHGLVGSLFRYEMLERLHRCVSARNVAVLAFGFGRDALRLVVEGKEEAISRSLKGFKVGCSRTASRWGMHGASSFFRQDVDASSLAEAIAWAHSAPMALGIRCPLESPWSSHRDLLGFRVAPFFDAAHVERRADPQTVHALCGGSKLPKGWPPGVETREELGLLLRIAGGVLGVLPADRRCFRLFVHLAKRRGWRTIEVARALALTTRRVRQLSSESEERIGLAMLSLADQRLCRVP